MQPALVVHDRLPVVRLIDRLKTTPTRLAVVADDHGNIEGVVTPTDVLAAIAGDLVEEEDAEPEPERLADGSIRFDGLTPIEQAGEILGLRAMKEGGGYTTMAGFAMWRLGHIPEENERFEWEGWRFIIEKMDGYRIDALRAEPAE
jgi:CBS domain containing-hemolysin-like protein